MKKMCDNDACLWRFSSFERNLRNKIGRLSRRELLSSLHRRLFPIVSGNRCSTFSVGEAAQLVLKMAQPVSLAVKPTSSYLRQDEVAKTIFVGAFNETLHAMNLLHTAKQLFVGTTLPSGWFSRFLKVTETLNAKNICISNLKSF